MSEPAAEQVTGTKMTNVHVEIGPGLKLGKKTDLQALIAGSGRHVNPVVLEDMYSVDADGAASAHACACILSIACACGVT